MSTSPSPDADVLSSEQRPTAVLVTYSCIPDDPRVRRAGDYLAKSGWRVVGVGLPGARAEPPGWPVFAAPEPAPGSDETKRAGARQRALSMLGVPAAPVGWIAAGVAAAAGVVLKPFRPRLARFAIHAAGRLVRPRVWLPWTLHAAWRLLAVRRKGAAAEAEFWGLAPALPRMREVALAHGAAGVWVANDWLALPIAAAGVARHGGVLVYDSHEFAIEEYAERLEWRLFQRPLVRTIEESLIRRAAVVTAVSPGIARALADLYGLDAPTFAVRNMPPYSAATFRPTGAIIRVLYHGVVAPGRGLEETIDSVAAWRPEFALTIRGPSSPPDYGRSLVARAAAAGVKDRVVFEPPAPATDLVRLASAHDVGFFALPGHSRHNELALPNKIFEYMMAGLALVVSDLPAMREAVVGAGCGVLIKDATAPSIAAAINGLDRASIDAFKRASLEAARDAHWDADFSRAEAAYRAALASASR